MEALLNKKDIENLVKRHLPYTDPLRWDGNGLVLDVDIDELRREEIKGKQVWLFKKETKLQKGDYAMCPIIRKNDTQYFLVVQ